MFFLRFIITFCFFIAFLYLYNRSHKVVIVADDYVCELAIKYYDELFYTPIVSCDTEGSASNTISSKYRVFIADILKEIDMDKIYATSRADGASILIAIHKAEEVLI